MTGPTEPRRDPGGDGPDDEARARDDALGLLAYRARSVAEMRRRLKKKGHAAPVVDDVVRWLREEGYLDDRAFARQFLEERLRWKPRGRFALVQELRKRGVERSTAESMVETVMEEEGVTEAELARSAARSWLDRQSRSTRIALRDGEPHEEAEAARRRLYGYLERRGFRYGTARRAVEDVRTGPDRG